PVLYVTAEESARQVKMRADRLGIAGALASGLFLLPETELTRILDAAGAGKFGAVVVDSIQTIASGESAGTPGSVTQVRECAGRLLTFAKGTGIPVFLIGHVTKDGTLAGPKTLEHLVDAVLSFEGEPFHARRLLRALKNRFGPVHELGVFEMTGSGLVEVPNPSSLYLGTGAGSRPGSAVLAGVEGTRPLLLEVQALTVEAKYGTPRRTAIGFDGTRLALILAVLERHAGLKLSGHDVFLNVAGGAESAEPAADLAVAAAVAGSLLGKALPRGTVVFGEIGLLGEVRAVSDVPLRLKESVALGFTGALLPAGNASEASPFSDLRVTPVGTVEELLARI
ncbi:MAG: DNA repair protein RadA, partial [Acidithiobacillales bacterium]